MSSDASYPPQLKTVSIEVRENYAIITLNRPPVNGMNLDLWSDLLAAIDATEKQPGMRGVIFASGLQKDIFTAGNDLNELYAKATTPERYQKFWTAQTTCLARLYATRLATVATIRGACPAGGCVFAMCCDYRIMTSDVPGAVIGLNEVALGISVPRYWIRLYERQLGNKAAELALLTGSMLTPEQAVKGGLLHAAVPKADLAAAGEKALRQMLIFPDAGRIATKRELRQQFADDWLGYCQEEADGAWKMLSSPAVTAALGKVIAKLSGAKPKPKL